MTKKTAGAERDDLDQDAIAMQESLAELVRVYQFRDRQRVCYYDVWVFGRTSCYDFCSEECMLEHCEIEHRTNKLLEDLDDHT